MILTRRWLLGCSFLIFCLLATALCAQEKEKREGLRVTQKSICTDVRDREPLGVDSTFSAAVGSLYCFTRIEGATDTTQVTHVWYHGEKRMTKITLPVKSARWRTWSNKKILPEWLGKWNVVILSEAGDPLAQLSFVIRAPKSE